MGVLCLSGPRRPTLQPMVWPKTSASPNRNQEIIRRQLAAYSLAHHGRQTPAPLESSTFPPTTTIRHITRFLTTRRGSTPVLIMATQAAIFAETIAGMKKAVKRRAYGMHWSLQLGASISNIDNADSDSDSSIENLTNRGNKLRKKARFVHEGQLSAPNGPLVYKRVCSCVPGTFYLLTELIRRTENRACRLSTRNN